MTAVAKSSHCVRLQYKSAFDAARVIAKEEGVMALYKGIKPALLRQSTYGGIRVGLYEVCCTSPCRVNPLTRSNTMHFAMPMPAHQVRTVWKSAYGKAHRYGGVCTCLRR
jgi:hypothetical protein